VREHFLAVLGCESSRVISLDPARSRPVQWLIHKKDMSHSGILLLLSLCGSAAGAPGAAASIGEMMSSLPVQVAPDTQSLGNAREIIKGLEKMPPPGAVLVERIDPVVAGEDSCVRDSEDSCPEGWVNVGPIKGGSTEYCHAGSQYHGPCADELQAFAEMSSTAKKRWSKGCQAFFPCKSCKFDYQSACPETWSSVGSGSKCTPTAHSGPCRGDANFDGYNAAMLEAWSDKCGAHWKCSMNMELQSFFSARPISKHATFQ